jgi:hypothetical protein
MNKKILTFGILFAVIAIAFVPTNTAQAFLGMETISATFFKAIAQLLMSISSLALIFTGMIFDEVLKITIVNMATNIGGSSGIGTSISGAWATLRDIANMCFIFVLLYAAFKAMFDLSFGNFQTTVKNIIIVALLINFSLFFSKVVIDASNIVAIGFYRSITSSNVSLVDDSGGIGSVANFRGISGGYMNMLGLQTLYSSNILNEDLGDPVQILIIGIMSAVFMLITSIILLISAIMFIARFIILIFIMILSPVALIAFVIPGMRHHFDSWVDALKNQSFFAPLFFALTWVVFRLGTAFKGTIIQQSSDFTSTFTNPSATVGLLINYILIIGMSIAALIFSKQMASKGITSKAFSAITGGIGAGAIGGAAWTGRKFVGGNLDRASNSSWLRNAATDGKYGSKYIARAGLWTANKGGKASFDVRASTALGKVPGLGDEMKILGKAGGKGGFAKENKDYMENKAKYAKDMYGQTESEKGAAKKLEDKYEAEKMAANAEIKKARSAEAQRRIDNAKTQKDKEDALNFEKEVNYKNKNKIFKDSDYEEHTPIFSKGIKEDYEKYAKAGERRQETFAKRLENEGINTTKAASKGITGGIIGAAVAGPIGAAIGAAIGSNIGKNRIAFNKSTATKIRIDSKGKSKEKKIFDDLKEAAKEATTEEAPEVPAAPTAPAEGASPNP